MPKMKTLSILLMVSLAVSVFALAATNQVAAQDDDYLEEMKKRAKAKKAKERAENGEPEEEEKGSVSRKKATERAEADAVKAPEGGVVWRGNRIVLAAISEASWCESGVHILKAGASVSVGSVNFVLDKKGVHFTGQFKTSKFHKPGEWEPSEFRVKVVDGKEQPIEKTVRTRSLKKGLDVEICDDTLNGSALLRIEVTWRGVVWGVVSGWEFKLPAETIKLVDADADGKCSETDRVIYGERSIWMPWHTVTTSGGMIYHEMEVASADSITALKMKMEDPGVDQKVWDAWQEERKDHGVPPGVFSKLRQGYCEKHAAYQKLHKEQGHDEDASKAGYSEEGLDAAQTSCIGYSGRAKATRGFIDSLYHRSQLINPENVGLQLGGNEYAYLMGFASDPKLPTESRSLPTPLLHPAPNSSYPNGTYGNENPLHPALAKSKKLGLPIIVKVSSFSPAFTEVNCKLYSVKGDLSTGQRGSEIRCHLSHAGNGTPAGFPNMWGMIALTPYSTLKPGIYEANFEFTEGGTEHKLHWRFRIGK